MSTTRHATWIDAPPARVHDALLDPRLIPRWRVPTGMQCRVHAFDAREGGAFRVSLTYDALDAVGKSSPQTDTYHGHFEELVPNRRNLEHIEFESEDLRMHGVMRIATDLAPEGNGTRLVATHENLPPGVSPTDNEAGWRESLEKLATLLRAAP